MNISVEDVRNALRKDDFEYMNVQIARYIEAAKASLYTALGEKVGGVSFMVKPEYAAEFETLTDSYIIEYCRAFIDQVDNERTLAILATQCETFITLKAEGKPHG